jgi:hypothetical protein
MLNYSPKDKFGFYQVGQFKTYSKVEAIELQRRTNQHPHWNFNEQVFGSFNWTVEPSESLEELYRQRAQQIRESYGYLVLFYSGGSDSDNMIRTFIKNQIPFEEIVTYSMHEADSDPNNFFHSELTQVAYPQIKQWQAQGIKFLHRNIDISKIVFNTIQNQRLGLDRVYFSNFAFGMNNLARSFIRESIPDYQDMVAQGKNFVFVTGTDKPRIHLEDNRMCLRFVDVIDGSVQPRTQLLDRAWEHD